MSIKGMTDRGMEFPQIGVIRKGAPKGEHAPGKDLNYFRVVFDEMEGMAQADFVAQYTAQPTEIQILLPFDDIERCWDAFVEAYTAGGLIYRGDGNRVLFWIDPETGEIKVKDGEPITSCIGADGLAGHYISQNGARQKIQAKAIGRLRVIVPSLKRLAYLLVVTSSKWDVMHISDQLAALKHVNGGRLAGIPMVLRRRPKQVSIPLKGKRARVTKWLLSIEAEPAWVAAQIEAMHRAALPEGAEILQLPAGQIIDISAAANGNDNGNGEASNPEGAAWSDETFDENIGESKAPASEEVPEPTSLGGVPPTAIDDTQAEPGPLPRTAKPNQKTATVSNDVGPKWDAFCNEFVGLYPHYAAQDGKKPNKFHIGALAVKLGVGTVTAANLPALMGQMHKYAKENHPK